MTHRKLVVEGLKGSLREVLGTGRVKHPLGRMAAGALSALTPLMALANPTGGQVVAGAATINNSGANRLVIDQSSQQAVINWQQFSVGAHQFVQFVQPDSSAVVLNRVISATPSRIFGDISANGQVFLVNPNGIFFAPGSSLDVQGLVASTLDISDHNFMQGNYVFSKGTNPDGSVLAQGSISAGRGGYVVLAGDYVENDGRIQAQGGRVYLAAAGSATLTLDDHQLISYTVDSATLARLAGVVNAGDIVATGGAVFMTGDVENALTATAVNNQGFISAKSIRSQSGTIVLSAEGGELVNSGTLDTDAASHADGIPGGTIVIRGNELTRLAPTSMIDAAGNGAGGFIDLSGHDLALRGQVTAGKGGNLLIDPGTINIVVGGISHAAVSSNVINSIGTAFIAGKLNNGSNVTLVATGTINGNAGSINATTGPNAGNSRFQLATGALTSCGAGGVCIGMSSFPAITHNSGTISISGLTINMKGQFVADASQGQVTLGAVTANSGIFITGGQIQVNGNLTAAGGILSLAANRGVAPGGFIKTASGVKLKAGDVSLNLGGSYGGVISVGAISGASVNVSLNYATLFSPAAPEKIVTGSIAGKHVSIRATGPKTSIDVNGSITAVNPTGGAGVDIVATGKGGNALITVNGNITVSGSGASAGNSLPFDLPLAASLRIEALGSGAGAHTAKVNGNIDVSALAGTYTRGSTCECGPSPPAPQRHQTGTGGVAAAYIIATGSHGSAVVNGSLSAKGPDAHVGLFASKVTVNGNINVAGSGHHVTRSAAGSGVSYTSSNSAGQATLQLGAGQAYTGSPAVSTTILGNSVKVAGNITVSGKGVAEAALFASNVSAGNITVTATAAKGKLKQKGVTTRACTNASHNDCTDLDSIGFYRGIGHVGLHSGSVNGGRADIIVSGGTSITSGSNGAPALNVKLGSLNVNGVGQAAIGLDGKAVQTHGITAVATKGTLKGTGSSVSGANNSGHYAHTFDINGGEADIKIRSGNSGSHSSGVLTQNGGPVTISGNISVTGPAANVDIKGKSVKVGGTVTVTGSGGSVTSDTVATPAGGAAFHTHFVGSEPTSLNLQGGASGSVSVAGKTTIKAPGIIGAIAVAGNVKLHGFSGSASAVKNYSVLDTRVSPTTQNLTLGSVGLIVADVKAVGGKPAFTSASNVGDMTVKAKGDVDLAAQIKLSGNLNVQAVGNINGSSNALVTHFNAIDNSRPRAGSHSGGGPNAGGLPHLAVTANAVAMVAGKNISLAGTQINVGNGSISSVHGDSTLLLALSEVGLAPASSNPNGAFIAGGSVSLGGLKLTGSYLLLQGTAVSVLGPVSVPAGALIQVAPFDPTSPMDIENLPVASAALTLVETNATTSSTFNLSNQTFLSLFPGTTIAVGNADETGNATIGANGILNIGSTNLIIDTAGTITGLSTVTSTGLVSSLLSILGPPVAPPTAGEIDPSTGSTTPPDNYKKTGAGADDAGGGGTGGTITQDTDTASVCH